MVVTKVRRLVANPHRRSRKRRNPRSGHRRGRMTAKQIKFFGTKRQKAALRHKRRGRPKHKRGTTLRALKVAINTRRKIRARRRKAPAKQRRNVNPALLVTLGAVNPRGGSMAARKRRKKAHRASNPRRRRRNTRVVVTAPRRPRVSHRRRRHNPRRRRNPGAFSMKGTGLAKAVVAGLAGVAAAKFIPTLIPAQFVQGNLIRTVATGASAFIAQWVAKIVVKDATISDAVLFGGLMQTGSTALNAFLPGIARQLGLSGLGTFVDGNFTIPENYLKRAPIMPAPAVAGLARAYGNGY